jgi:CRISPR/Cas system CMR-associated protein Cmr5 small subunit
MSDLVTFYKSKRAKSGKASMKAILLNELWHVENDITHLIISSSAGEEVGNSRSLLELERSRVITLLDSITR